MEVEKDKWRRKRSGGGVGREVEGEDEEKSWRRGGEGGGGRQQEGAIERGQP